MKLHIGGELKKDGWKILNIQKKDNVDFIGSITDLSQFENNSIEEIYASHVFEHVLQSEVNKTLKGIHRVFAWMTYLNDVDDGGETYFEHFDLKIKPEIGKTLIWPAEWTHAHKGEVLNKGLKYIITGWMHFPFKFKL